ncbi:BPL-N domain-containing protein [Parachlamydia sp. AcF125]|uniref:BPL-N domain-containing protein n=1 Tax=Parachlamydia sp. AcF125 TaxID=2795736 RepID=UPI001BC9CB0D|nr:BPL-N domain-containing protein [Parachlamydia sp. AcF125]MBS4168905.1 hypothetical protein [Parachlamydia sp. AcF125]
MNISNCPIDSGEIFIYHGPGIDRLCAQRIGNKFENTAASHYQVKYLKQISQLPLLDCYGKTLVVPGGHVLKILDGLTMQEVQRIRKFVALGGNYFGACAGAGIAAEGTCLHTSLESPPSKNSQLYSPKYLGLLKGNCFGPLFSHSNPDPSSPLHHRATAVKWVASEEIKKPFAIFSNHALGFHIPNQNAAKILLEYESHVPVAISTTFAEKGKVVLIGSHLEIQGHHLEEKWEKIKRKTQQILLHEHLPARMQEKLNAWESEEMRKTIHLLNTHKAEQQLAFKLLLQELHIQAREQWENSAASIKVSSHTSGDKKVSEIAD